MNTSNTTDRYTVWHGTTQGYSGYHVIDRWSGASTWQGHSAAETVAKCAVLNAERSARPQRQRIQHEGYYGHRYRRPRMDRRRKG
jgi:hypothetical protein